MELIDQTIREIEEINEKMNGATVVPDPNQSGMELVTLCRFLNYLQPTRCSLRSSFTVCSLLSMYAPCVTMLPPSDLFH